MSAWAIFNDEGLCEELDAANKTEAEEALRSGEWADDEHAHVAEMCEEHHGHEAWSCEECNGDEPEDDVDDE